MKVRIPFLIVLLGAFILLLLTLVFNDSHTGTLIVSRLSTAESYLLHIRREGLVPVQNGNESPLDWNSSSLTHLRLFSYDSEEQSTKKTAREYDITPLMIKETKCNDSICSQYLSPAERDSFRWCVNKTLAMKAKYGPILPGTCRFMNGSGRYPVALASSPGSGNTWVRGLLEKVTGICSGALYCDGTFRTKGFTGEGVKGSSVILVKTHNLHPQFVGDGVPPGTFAGVYGSAILLLRNPLDVLVSDWHRGRSNRRVNATVSNHFLYVGEEWFGNNKMWNKSIPVKGTRWQKHTVAWLKRFRERRILVVQYEKLKNDTVGGVKRILDFLGLKYSREEISQRLEGGYTSFYRNHRDDFEHFTPSQRAFMTNMVNETIQMLDECNVGDVFPIHDYL